MDADDRKLFAGSLRQLTDDHAGEPIDDALDALGWRDALADDARSAVPIVFEHLGRANATAAALDDVLGSVLDAGRADPQETAVVQPALGSCEPPGRLDGGHLIVRGLGGAGLRNRPRATLVATAGERLVLATIETARLARTPVAGMDPAFGLVQVTANLAAEPPTLDSSQALPPERWDAAVALAQRALTHELVGASKAMLQLAREHALDRIQFGRPISTFQAVRHRLADSLVAIEAAESAADAAWEDASPLAASLAKAIAGRSARTVTRHAQQVLAGMGFTAEHAFHHYLRRTLLIDELFGASRTLTRRIGQELLQTRQLPAMLPL